MFSANPAQQLHNLIRLGSVSAVDVASAVCRVKTGEVETDWIPWLVPRAGQVIEWSAPSVGEQVLVLASGGDLHAAVAVRGIYSTAFAAPDASQTRHLVLYPDGALVAYDHGTHALNATLPAGGTVEITADGGITLNGDLTVNGDTQHNGDVAVSGTATAEVDVVGAGISLKGHKHTGVQAGSATSGPPQ